MGDLTEENQTPEDGSGDSKKPYNFTPVSFNIDQHLEFIDISEGGHLLLGSSNLVIKNWSGSIWLFNSSDVTPSEDESLCSLCCESCVSCGQFIDNWEKVIFGEDSGKLSILTISNYEDNTSHFLPNLSDTHHDGCILSLCLIDGNSTAVTAGSDLRINLWDINSLELQQKYVPAHSSDISCVISSYDKSSQLFTSCGLDGAALIWDTRQSKPASGIFEHEFGLTSLSWKDEHVLAVGSLTGDVHLTDIRNKKSFHTLNFSKHSVHQIKTCPNGELAVCGNSNDIKVWDTSSFKLVYSNAAHTGLVRCLSWNPTNNMLYSCGFDKRIYSHKISTQYTRFEDLE